MPTKLNEVEIFQVNVKNRMEYLGLTQAQLAAKAGLGQAAVSLIASGRREPTLQTALKLSEALGKSIAVMTTRVLHGGSSGRKAHKKAKKSLRASPQ